MILQQNTINWNWQNDHFVAIAEIPRAIGLRNNGERVEGTIIRWPRDFGTNLSLQNYVSQWYKCEMLFCVNCVVAGDATAFERKLFTTTFLRTNDTNEAATNNKGINEQHQQQPLQQYSLDMIWMCECVSGCLTVWPVWWVCQRVCVFATTAMSELLFGFELLLGSGAFKMKLHVFMGIELVKIIFAMVNRMFLYFSCCRLSSFVMCRRRCCHLYVAWMGIQLAVSRIISVAFFHSTNCCHEYAARHRHTHTRETRERSR